MFFYKLCNISKNFYVQTSIPIKLDTYERCYPSRLKRIFRSNINYRTYNDFVPKTKNPIIGNIPPELIRFFPKETRGEKIKAIQEAFGETAVYLRKTFFKMNRQDDFKIYDENYRPSKYLKKLAHDAKKLLNARLDEIAGTGNLKATLKFIKDGGFSNVFRLSIRDAEDNKIMHDKALKVFDTIEESYLEYSIKHNNYAEANFWTFLKYFAGHNLDKTQFTKHYISDTKNGYCLTEFIDPDIHRTTSSINYIRTFGIDTPLDHIYNPSIMGKTYDGGGYTRGDYFTSDKIVIRYFKKLLNRSKKELPTVLANIEALAQNPKTPHRDKIQQALDLFKN